MDGNMLLEKTGRRRIHALSGGSNAHNITKNTSNMRTSQALVHREDLRLEGAIMPYLFTPHLDQCRKRRSPSANCLPLNTTETDLCAGGSVEEHGEEITGSLSRK